jgi:hypothetical protein
MYVVVAAGRLTDWGDLGESLNDHQAVTTARGATIIVPIDVL